MRGRSDWLPREETFCAYVKRHQIMRANCRLSEVRTLFYQVLRDHFGGDMAALARALDTLCKGLDESLYNVCTNPLVFENETLEVSDDDDSE